MNMPTWFIVLFIVSGLLFVWAAERPGWDTLAYALVVVVGILWFLLSDRDD
jgi:hypothetical protein